jgi:Domain of unknown function (DUF4386)
MKPRTSPRQRARIAGVLYLLSIACGLFAEAVVRSKLVIYANPALTAQNILAAPGLYRAGFFADLAAMTCGVLASVILYSLFKPVSRSLALGMLALDVISNTVSLSASVLLFAPLIILQGAGGLSAFSPSQVQSLALLSIRLYELGYGISLALFSGSCLLIGYLILRSRFLPKFLGLLLPVAGICYFTNSFVNLMPAGFGDFLFPWILLPCLIAEASLALWLTLFGVDSSQWEATALSAQLWGSKASGTLSPRPQDN